MSKTAILGIAIVIVLTVAYGAFVLLGAWIDGRRQAVRNKGLHPVTTPEGNVEAREHDGKGQHDQDRNQTSTDA